ncbi:DUF3025 domain-containing protein [Uliginosibacterium sediminicola]|uniref:DUF3025 domain-containing protein n=1 Tax=Uliginosibacterium sediminicola TaxID=2024550 RepID=A0ABU9YUG4_9RHOO
MHPFTASLDLRKPWLAAISEAAGAVLAQDDWRAALQARCAALGLVNHRGLALAFASQDELPEGVAYESFISDTGRVPTRDNLHDLFNALVWLSFPRTKCQLNALQAAQIAQAGVGAVRGRTRDAITLFDENAALLVLRDVPAGRALVEALRAHAWPQFFVEGRAALAEHAEVWLFGHALMEKLCAPYKGITAHAWVLMAPEEFFALAHAARRAWLDQQLAAELARRTPAQLTPACFTPLPVLGWPGWWPGQDAAFYADATVFRPPRARRNPA